jgi:hypothetical protein
LEINHGFRHPLVAGLHAHHGIRVKLRGKSFKFRVDGVAA